MSPEVIARLDVLAVKLGVAADHLWAVLVRQAYVEAAYGAVTAVALGVLIRLLHGALDRHKKACDDYHCSCRDIAVVLVWATSALLAIGVLMALDDTKWAFNPEAYAAQTIFSVVSK